MGTPRLQFDVVGVCTASQAFRDQMGAFAEMAQIWIREDDLTVELEHFDIHRPNPAPPGRSVTSSSTDNARACLAGAVPDVLRFVVADDEIWHHGVWAPPNTRRPPCPTIAEYRFGQDE